MIQYPINLNYLQKLQFETLLRLICPGKPGSVITSLHCAVAQDPMVVRQVRVLVVVRLHKIHPW
jgi:hypothetical protein